MKKIAFLDRDGVINKEVNYLHKWEDFEFTDSCIDALKILIGKGYELVIVTNQAGIAKGLFSESNYQELTDKYRNYLSGCGIEFLDILHCPHHVDAVKDDYRCDCFCRKPNPGMIDKITSNFNVSLENSIMVGDKISDVKAGLGGGLTNVYLVETGHPLKEADYLEFKVFKNLNELACAL